MRTTVYNSYQRMQNSYKVHTLSNELLSQQIPKVVAMATNILMCLLRPEAQTFAWKKQLAIKEKWLALGGFHYYDFRTHSYSLGA